MFQLKQQCVIEHVNTRKGTNDESVVAIDVKISVEDLPASVAAAALRADDVEDVMCLFADDADQGKRFIGMNGIPIDEAWEGTHQIKISSLPKMRVVKLQKIVLFPRAKGLFDATFTVTVEDPPENYLDSVAKRLHSSTSVHLEQDVPELPLKQKKEEADADRKPGRVKKSEPAQAAFH